MSKNRYREFFSTCLHCLNHSRIVRSRIPVPSEDSHVHGGLTFLPRYSSLESMRSEWPKNSFLEISFFPWKKKRKEKKGRSWPFWKYSGNTTYIILTLIGPYNFPDNSTIIILGNPSIRPRSFHPGTKMPPSKTPFLNNGLHMLPIYHPFALRNGFGR